MVIYHASRYLVNLDVSSLSKETGDNFEFSQVNPLSNYSNNNLVNYYPLPLFDVNITAEPTDLNTIYYSQTSNFQFAVNFNVTHNCNYFVDTLQYEINTKLSIPNEYIYTFSGEPGYFYVKIYPFIGTVNVTEVLPLIVNKQFLSEHCRLYGNKTLEYQGYIINSISGEVMNKYPDNTQPSTTSSSGSTPKPTDSESPSIASNIIVNIFTILFTILINLVIFI
ncbi:hypothetical protein DLAC_01334 [Tieghemostelium lacteum]|uniref:Uncharacterized protein n=1 Tax=Tieghemostelium lacteum TaxID=361077 RepID=A0A152A8C2_TIELA|nr:hypothetical protein DLAC_01334 [Tieghemostelium lacteum]|eukprot:KYR02490.1 hypothetical protein DLAC_01334 [Tieghemostelium lacteum]